MNETRRSYRWYIVKLLGKELVAGLIIGALLAYYLGYPLAFLNYELFIQSLVALNSGIIIALFVALFYSSNENITIFKKFTNAAKQIYILFLINSSIVCILALFMSNIDDTTPRHLIVMQQWSNLLAASLAAVASAVNIRFIYQLLQVSFRH